MIRSYITWESLYYLNGYLGKPLKKIGEQLRRHFLVFRICRIRDVRSPFHSRYTFRVTYRVKRVVNFRSRSPASRARSERSPAFPILMSTLVSVPARSLSVPQWARWAGTLGERASTLTSKKMTTHYNEGISMVSQRICRRAVGKISGEQ